MFHYNMIFLSFCRHSVNESSIVDRYASDIIELQGHQRHKRGFWDGLEFKLSTPSVDWQKKVGTKELGASFGIVLENYLDLKIGKLFAFILI